jgi:hypothetical protein
MVIYFTKKNNIAKYNHGSQTGSAMPPEDNATRKRKHDGAESVIKDDSVFFYSFFIFLFFIFFLTYIFVDI